MECKNDKTLFSIVIPTYNHAQFINRCLDSVISQTYSNWEAIVVNNYSEDNTIELVNGYNDKRIRLVNFHNNGIIAVSRNIGIKAAKGEWICFLDSDDWWYPNKLEIVCQHISNNQHIDVVCHDLILNNLLSGKMHLLSSGPVVPDLYRILLLNGNRFSNSALSIKKASLEKNKINLCESKDVIGVEDFDLSLQLAACNALFSCINIPLGEYTVGINNISNSNVQLKNQEFLLRKHVFEIQTFDPNKLKLWGKVRSRLIMLKGAISFRRHRYRESISYFLFAIKLSRSGFLRYVSIRISFRLKLLIIR